MRSAAICVLVGVLLAACGEQVQTIPVGAERKVHISNFQGTDNPYRASGWKPGDQASWEAHLRARTQAQNEYATIK